MSGKVPVRLLNAREKTVTVTAGLEIATLESVKPPPDTVEAKVDNPIQTHEKEEVLSRLVEENGGNISADEKEQLLTLLRQSADVFAASESDLGRTGNLKHEIHREMPPQSTRQYAVYLPKVDRRCKSYSLIGCRLSLN